MRPHHAPRTRAGLTTVEVLVAITLLVTGISATLSVHAASSALATRSRQRRWLAVRATSVLDSLRARSCTTVGSGTAASPEGTLTWRVIPAPGSITVQLNAAPSRGTPWRAETILPCP
jgi:Tfp pilus assembly protein PilV